MTPWCCTSGGSCASAVCTRLLTLTVSMSGIGAELEADGQVVAAVIAAGRLHVDHLVDADDLRFERLGDGGFDHRRRGAGVGRGDLHLRRHDVGELRDRDARSARSAPAIVMRIAMTIASRGRSTKTAEIMPLMTCPSSPCAAGGGAARAGLTCDARPHALHPLGDDQSRLP